MILINVSLVWALSWRISVVFIWCILSLRWCRPILSIGPTPCNICSLTTCIKWIWLFVSPLVIKSLAYVCNIRICSRLISVLIPTELSNILLYRVSVRLLLCISAPVLSCVAIPSSVIARCGPVLSPRWLITCRISSVLSYKWVLICVLCCEFTCVFFKPDFVLIVPSADWDGFLLFGIISPHL